MTKEPLLGDQVARELDDSVKEMLTSGQSFASLLLDYNECAQCSYAYKGSPTGDHECPACHSATRIGRSFGCMTIYSLIELIQDHYRMDLGRIRADGSRASEKKEPRHFIGILFLYCTFVECWMESFLRSLMRVRGLDAMICDQLLRDNWSLSKRRGELFKTLTGQAFGDALQRISSANKARGPGYLNYEQEWNRAVRISRARNAVIHGGAVYNVSVELIEECIQSIHGVNSLFVELHNEFMAERAAPTIVTR